MTYSKPKYILYAGVNGSGKSTLYNSQKIYHKLPRINTDDIVKSLGSWEDSKNQMVAGKMAIRQLKSHFEDKESFTQETTLCGKSIINNIRKAKELGYYVEIHYVGVNHVDICKERIKYRVSRGGHGIPDEDVERRYIESFQNMKSILPFVDNVYFYDNSNFINRIAIYKTGKLIFQSSEKPNWFERITDK